MSALIWAALALLVALGAALLVLARRDRIEAESSGGPRAAAERTYPPALTRMAAMAGGGVSEAEVSVIWLAATALPPLAGVMLGLGASSLALALAGFAAVPLWALSQSRGRKRMFDDQLGETMPLIASNLRAGQSVAAAIAPVATTMEEPLRGEFARLSADVRAGIPLVSALDAMAKRNGSKDLRLFAVAVRVSQQRGGSLAEITERVGETVRARGEMRRFIRAKTALNRFEAYFLTGMPVAMFAALMVMSPTHREFYSSPAGLLVLAVCALLDVAGLLVMFKMGDFSTD